MVLVGKEKKDRIMSQEERRIVSYHEVGHALVSALQKDAEPVQKITIVPRTMGALGYVMQTPEEEKFLNTKKELEAMLVSMLAGRAAEEIVFDTVTTGASNDIEKATKTARAMITQYGMSEKFGLTSRESEILTLIVQGKKQGQVARDLYIAPSTVKTHIKHLYQKLDVHSRAELSELVGVELGE